MLTEIRDKQAIERFCKVDAALHIYELGDLDPFFWGHTRWWAWSRGGEIRALALVYQGTDPGSLLLLETTPTEDAAALLEALQPHLPDRIHAHISPQLLSHLPGWRRSNTHAMLKMFLSKPDLVLSHETKALEMLTPRDLPEIQQFYERAYPENWFDPRMLETRQYAGARISGELVAVAGIHVYSPRYAVAALGNIATIPEHRGRGFGKAVTARVCQSLLQSVSLVGLNVAEANIAAIRCYEALGFKKHAHFVEIDCVRADLLRERKEV